MTGERPEGVALALLLDLIVPGDTLDLKGGTRSPILRLAKCL